MTSEASGPVPGTLIRAADGTISFIPDAVLKAYQVPAELQSEAQRLLGDRNEVQGYAQAAQGSQQWAGALNQGSGSDVQGYSAGQARQWSGSLNWGSQQNP